MFQHKVKINVDGEDYIENITIDTKNQTETFRILKMNSVPTLGRWTLFTTLSKVRVGLLTNLFRTVSLVNLIPYFFFLNRIFAKTTLFANQIFFDCSFSASL